MSINSSYLVSLRYSHLPLRRLYYVGWCSPNFVLSQNWIFPDKASKYIKYMTEKSPFTHIYDLDLSLLNI